MSFLNLFGRRPERPAADEPPDLLTGLEAYWRLDGSGDDSSGNGRTLVPGTKMTYGAGQIVNGLTGGDGSYAGFGNLSVYSISGWLRSSGGGLNGTAGSLALRNMAESLIGGSPISVVGNGTDERVGIGGIAGPWFAGDGASWKHFVIVVPGTGVAYSGYIDGDLVGETGSGGRLNRVTIDAVADGSGGVDEVAVYSVALSASQVAALYNGGAGFDPTA